MKPIDIANHKVGPNYPCFIVAEAGVNHNGDMEIAYQLIDAAAEAGVDAIKFQAFVTEELITLDAPRANYQVLSTGESSSQYDMLKSLELTTDQQEELKIYCENLGIVYLCTPYENSSVDMLDNLGVVAFKIASTDTTNIPFLRYIAQKNRPVILSTGMSTLGEVELAVSTLQDNGLEGKIVILQCTSEYPAPMNEINLRAMITMQQAFNCPVGFSDHTPGIGAGPWAVAIGACLVEKHFTLDRNMTGPDHRASLQSDELSQLVQTIRNVEVALGDGVKKLVPSEKSNKRYMQKSLVARNFIPKGQRICSDDLTLKRPAIGLVPKLWDQVVGRRAACDIQVDEILKMESIDWLDNS